MKFIKPQIIVLIVLSLLFSCKTEKSDTKLVTSEKSSVDKDAIAKLEKMEFHIKGMTCEIGCARLIQSKLSKKEGIKFAKVSFTDSLGMVEFDANKLSHNDIVKVVEGIADGDLYKVKDKQAVAKFSIKK